MAFGLYFTWSLLVTPLSILPVLLHCALPATMEKHLRKHKAKSVFLPVSCFLKYFGYHGAKVINHASTIKHNSRL